MTRVAKQDAASTKDLHIEINPRSRDMHALPIFRMDYLYLDL